MVFFNFNLFQMIGIVLASIFTFLLISYVIYSIAEVKKEMKDEENHINRHIVKVRKVHRNE